MSTHSARRSNLINLQLWMSLVISSCVTCVLIAAQIPRSFAENIGSELAPAVPAGKRSAKGWPDATNTGVPAGIVLEPSGDLVISQAGAVVSGLDIRGAVEVNAPNVTLTNSRIRAAKFDVVGIKSGMQGVVIQDCEIDGTGIHNEGSNGIRGSGTFLRNNIHHVENGMTLTGSATILDNYIHDLLASGSPHYDGIQIDGGVSDVVIRHNTVINSHAQTSAVMIDSYFGAISNIAVDSNRLIGGGYTVYSDGQFSGGTISGVSFTGNRLGKGRWGYRSFVKNVPEWFGNVDDLTGRVLR
ncbi:hypothetical protein V1282_002382 [Nitrobacteraceae bacterium AZCC 2146]